jgi:hypothetical protein
MLISGLQSVLFAINIDNTSLNIPAKISKPNSIPIGINAMNSLVQSKEKTNSSQNIESQSFTDNTSTSKLVTSKKIRKNNVILFDTDTKVEARKHSEMQDNLSPLNNGNTAEPTKPNDINHQAKSKFKYLTNPINYNAKKNSHKPSETVVESETKISFSLSNIDEHQYLSKGYATNPESNSLVNGFSTFLYQEKDDSIQSKSQTDLAASQTVEIKAEITNEERKNNLSDASEEELPFEANIYK